MIEQIKKSVLFPELDSEDILEAIKILKEKGIEIKTLEDFNDVDIDILAEHYFNKRKSQDKDITFEEAKEKMQDKLYKAATLVSLGYANAVLAGKTSTTREVILSVVRAIGLHESVGKMSSFFIMKFKDRPDLFFADCAVNEKPNASELAEIAILTADNFVRIKKEEARVAMISHSTLGSAPNSVNAQRIVEATNLVRQKRPDIKIVGEIQLDAAMNRKIAETKMKSEVGEVAGRANVLVFPDGETGNIVYKAVQEFAGAQALGPFFQGQAKEMHDLSRGASADDIVKIVETIVEMLKYEKK
jgi:phosphate acetyltransferase